MPKFVKEVFAASLISESVMKSENFADIVNSGLCSRIEVVEEIKEYCHCLLYNY